MQRNCKNQENVGGVCGIVSSWGGAGCQRGHMIMMGLMTPSPFIVTEETGGKGACSGGNHGESWFRATRLCRK